MPIGNFCVLCKHFQPNEIAPTCARAQYEDPVFGTTYFRTCYTERNCEVTGCGQNGKFFEHQYLSKQGSGGKEK